MHRHPSLPPVDRAGVRAGGLRPHLGEHRVFFRKPQEERVHSLPARWTDVEGVDPFLAISAGRAHFRVEDLVALVSLVQELKSREV
ncbi:MAG: Y4bD/Y4pK family protein [Thermoleophilia bacterium]|nr:Y4bD/Y4pK family protein [Thermoleophilia bacterium]